MANNYNIGVDLTAVLASVDPLYAEMLQRSVSNTAVAQEGSNVFSDIVNITDKGILNCVQSYIYSFTAASSICIKITIDGVDIYDSKIWYFTKVGDGGILTFNHRFNTSLQVQHKIFANTKGITWSVVAYNTD